MEYKKTILWVDDMFKDQKWKYDFNYFFEPAGYNLVIFTLGYNAVKEMENGLRYDLGIVDLRLPDMDGYKVIIQSKEIYPEIPWFIFSAFPFPFPLSERGIEKPQDPSYLVRLVDDFFKKREKQ